MNKFKRLLCSALVVVLLVSSLTGCLSSAKFNKTIFTYAGVDVPLKNVWINAIPEIEEYTLYYGTTIWDEKFAEDADGVEITFKQAIVDDIISNVKEVYEFLYVKDKYECELTEEEKEELALVVDNYATQYNDKLKDTSITEDDLTEVFTDNYMASKIYEQVRDEYIEKLNKEDYTRSVYYDYCIASTDYNAAGEEIELSDSVYAECEEKMNSIFKKLENGENIEDIVEDNVTNESSEITIGKDNESSYPEKLVKEANKLKKTGDYSKVFKTDGYWHILVLTDLEDDEATEEALTLAANEMIEDEFLPEIRKAFCELDDEGEPNTDVEIDESCLEILYEVFITKDELDESKIDINSGSEETSTVEEATTETAE